jgi:hypothetical protein
MQRRQGYRSAPVVAMKTGCRSREELQYPRACLYKGIFHATRPGTHNLFQLDVPEAMLLEFIRPKKGGIL